MEGTVPGSPGMTTARATCIAWLWNAPGPGDQRGVCGSIGRAQRRAEDCLHAGAPAVVVESAVIVTDPQTLRPSYAPTGHRWTGSLHNGQPVWRRRLRTVIA
jgi:hypothetical protein